MIEVIAGLNLGRNDIYLNKGMAFTDVPKRCGGPECIGIVGVDRIRVLLVTQDNDAVVLPAHIAWVLANLHDQLIRIND